MSDCERIPLIEYHSLNTVKYTLLEKQKNTKSYLNKLITCNICIIINIINIFLIRFGISILYFLDPALSIKLEALIIIIVTAYIFLSCLLIVKVRLTRKILTISKQFNIHMNKICAVFIISIVVDLSLYVAYYAIVPNNITSDTILSNTENKKILYILSTLSIFFVYVIIIMDIGYNYYFRSRNHE